jgi:excisionase family DNA binding protein
MTFPDGPFAPTSGPTDSLDRRHRLAPPILGEPNPSSSDRGEEAFDRNISSGDVLARLVTPEEAAERLRISRAQVYVLLRTGSLESVQIGRSRRIPVVALANFIGALRKKRDT